MNKKIHRNHRHGNEPCRDCEPDLRFGLLRIEEIMNLITDSDEIFSLKVYGAAFVIAMQKFTEQAEQAEQAEGAEASLLLDLCSDQIARGHKMVIQ